MFGTCGEYVGPEFYLPAEGEGSRDGDGGYGAEDDFADFHYVVFLALFGVEAQGRF